MNCNKSKVNTGILSFTVNQDKHVGMALKSFKKLGSLRNENCKTLKVYLVSQRKVSFINIQLKETINICTDLIHKESYIVDEFCH